MTASAAKTVDTEQGALARARGLAALLSASRGRIETERELPADVLAALHQARMFRLLLPRSIGGDELDLVTHSNLIGIIAAADASTAWVMGQGAGCAMASAFLAPADARRLFGPPDAVLAWGAGIQGRAVAAPGGYRVTGTWTFNSGSRHATLLGGHSFVVEADGSPRRRADGRPLDRTMLLARCKATVRDNWHVVGLKGTGSDTFSVEDLFVPENETIDRDSADECREAGPLYKFPTTIAFAAGFSGLMLGLARGAIDDLTHLAMTKTQRGAAVSLRESPVFQGELAQLEARQRASRAYLDQTIGRIWGEVAAGNALTLQARADFKLATTYAINQGVEVVIGAYRLAGNDAIFLSGPFEQRMRDALTASQQTQGRPLNYITIGRMLLGLPPDSMAFL